MFFRVSNILVASVGCVLFFSQYVQAQQNQHEPKAVLKCTNLFSSTRPGASRVLAQARRILKDEFCNFTAKVGYYDPTAALSNGAGAGIANFVYNPTTPIANSRVTYRGTVEGLLHHPNSFIYKSSGGGLSENELLIDGLDLDNVGIDRSNASLLTLPSGRCSAASVRLEVLSNFNNRTTVYHTIRRWSCVPN